MKANKAWLALAVLLMAFMAVGCDLIFGALFKLVGDWTVEYTWSGYGTGTMSMSFYADGTFYTDESQGGYWDQDGLEVGWTYTIGGNAVYSGELDFGGSTMSGTMYDPDGGSGTWSGYKTGSRSLGKAPVKEGPTGGSAD
ncbi:MAG TPA: hypothetical protein VIO60_10285 [Rectinemataceae bacterium]